MIYLKNNKCYVCEGRILSEEDLTICEYCNNIYHKLCWQEVKEQCIYCNKTKDIHESEKNKCK